MITSQKKLPNSRMQLTINATADQFRQAFDHELKHLSEGLTLPGFRPGKAPRDKVIERVGRSKIEAGALDHLISDAFYQAMKEASLAPVESPQIELVQYEAPSEDAAPETPVATFKAEVDVIPEVKVEGYQKIKVTKPAEPTVGEDDVEKVLTYLLRQRATLEPAGPETVLENGMWADIGYVGSVGGVKREDMKNEHHPLVIGEGQLIPGFEEAILGMKVGEERVIKVTFPKEYQSSELAGKKAEFTVKLHELKTVTMPPRDDAFAIDFGHPTFAKLEQAVRENLHEEKQVESKRELEQEVVDQLAKLSKVELPQALVDQEMERMFSESKERLEQNGFNWETYLTQVKKTEAEVREEMRPQAERNVKIGLALGEIIRQEKLESEPNPGRAAVDRLVEIATAGK